MAWKLVNPNITNDPSYLEPQVNDIDSRVTNNTTSLAQKAQQTDLVSVRTQFNSHLQDVIPHEDFLLYDSFGRADSLTSIGNAETTGNAYTIISQNSDHVWGIRSGQTYTVSGTTNTRGIAYQETNEPNCNIEVNISGATANNSGIAFRVTDLNNFFHAYLSTSGVYLAKYAAGTFTSLGGKSVNGVTSGKLTIICNNNKIELYFNDNLIYETYDSFNNTATKHGLYTRMDTNVNYDNFCVKKVAKKKQYQYSLPGNVSTLPWFMGYENAGQPYSYQQSSTVQDNGVNSHRFELRYGDADAAVAGSKRSEIHTGPEKALGEYWYSLDIFLPNGGDEDYGVDSQPEIITQWHSSPDAGESSLTISPPLSLQTQNGHYHLINSWDANFLFSHNNEYNDPDKNWTVNIDLGDYSADKGKWVNWTYHVKWGWLAVQNPILEVYKDGVQVVNRNGLPNTYNDQVGVYFKFGIYKWPWASAPSDVSKRVIYYNNVTVK